MIKLTGRIRSPRLAGSINLVPAEGGGGPLQAKTAYPSHSEQVIAPDEDYHGLVAVTVKAVPRLPAAVASVEEGWGIEVGPTVNLAVGVSAIGEEILYSHEVVTVDGATYGFGTGEYMESETIQFGANPSGYYTSGNKGVNSSYAICKIVFNTPTERIVTLNCINYAEKNCDYGIISAVDTMLALDTSDDGATGSTNVIKNFKGESSADVVPIEITIPAGEHFVCVKFRKDGSSASGYDSLKFSISV